MSVGQKPIGMKSKLTLLVLPGLLFGILNAELCSSEAGAVRKPNIVTILADDLGYGSLGCYGNTGIKTPNIDGLAAGGVRLTDFHSNGSVCSPTRASLLTGRYQQRCAWVGHAELSPVFREQRKQNLPQRWAWGISTNELTIPKLLKQAAYHTGIIGKWHLGYDAKFHPMNYGFDEFRGFMGGNVDYHKHIARYGLKQLDWWHNREIKNEEGYTTDLLTRYTTDFIARNKDVVRRVLAAHLCPERRDNGPSWLTLLGHRNDTGGLLRQQAPSFRWVCDRQVT
jgi:arylsulfatase A